MISLLRKYICAFFNILPTSRLFRLKRFLLNQLKIAVGKNSSINGDMAIYGDGDIVPNSIVGGVPALLIKTLAGCLCAGD
jgi:hypothetical protein